MADVGSGKLPNFKVLLNLYLNFTYFVTIIRNLGHIMRINNRYGLLQLILQGTIENKTIVIRRRISWLKNLPDWLTTTIELFRSSLMDDKVMIYQHNKTRNYSQKLEEQVSSSFFLVFTK